MRTVSGTTGRHMLGETFKEGMFPQILHTPKTSSRSIFVYSAVLA
jgi:hypothetical protein